MPLSDIRFQLAKLKPENKNFIYKNVSLPTKEYEWSLQDPSYGTIQDDGKLSCK